MQKLKLKLTLAKGREGEYEDTVILYKEQVTCIVESTESDAFCNDHPNEEWLCYLAEKQLGIDRTTLLGIDEIK